MRGLAATGWRGVARDVGATTGDAPEEAGADLAVGEEGIAELRRGGMASLDAGVDGLGDAVTAGWAGAPGDGITTDRPQPEHLTARPANVAGAANFLPHPLHPNEMFVTLAADMGRAQPFRGGGGGGGGSGRLRSGPPGFRISGVGVFSGCGTIRPGECSGFWAPTIDRGGGGGGGNDRLACTVGPPC